MDQHKIDMSTSSCKLLYYLFLIIALVPDSPTSSKKSLFVNLTKKSKKGKELGLEFSKDVQSDHDFLRKIFETGSYATSSEVLIDYYEEIGRMIVILVVASLFSGRNLE
jgi:hypothetical protein